MAPKLCTPSLLHITCSFIILHISQYSQQPNQWKLFCRLAIPSSKGGSAKISQSSWWNLIWTSLMGRNGTTLAVFKQEWQLSTSLDSCKLFFMHKLIILIQYAPYSYCIWYFPVSFDLLLLKFAIKVFIALSNSFVFCIMQSKYIM